MSIKINDNATSGAPDPCCEADDLVSRKSGILLWCVPILALIAGSVWPKMHFWLWIPALLVMGIACLVNAKRCGRLHCYLTGPVFLVAAGYVELAAAGVAPIRPGVFLLGLCAIAMLACLAEVPLGKYRKRV